MKGAYAFTMSDYDLIEARFTISALQTELDRATARVNELQATLGAMNKRLAVGHEEIENLALDLSLERLRGKIADAAEAQRTRTRLKVV
jgi:flagellin-like hook-associated protein FlgL